jgi:hypothetical protein
MRGPGVKVVITGSDGFEHVVELSPEELREIGVDGRALLSDEGQSAAIEAAIYRGIRVHDDGWSPDTIKVHLTGLEVLDKPSLDRVLWPERVSDSSARHVARCHALLRLANFALPPAVREEALDEWMDEIQCAAEKGLPFRRRALSILCRSLPALALRARLPIRSRRGEN